MFFLYYSIIATQKQTRGQIWKLTSDSKRQWPHVNVNNWKKVCQGVRVCRKETWKPSEAFAAAASVEEVELQGQSCKPTITIGNSDGQAQRAQTTLCCLSFVKRRSHIIFCIRGVRLTQFPALAISHPSLWYRCWTAMLTNTRSVLLFDYKSSLWVVSRFLNLIRAMSETSIGCSSQQKPFYAPVLSIRE